VPPSSSGEGLEGKSNERLETALRLDPTFERGGPLLLEGRYYYELPWPEAKAREAILEVTQGSVGS